MAKKAAKAKSAKKGTARKGVAKKGAAKKGAKKTTSRKRSAKKAGGQKRELLKRGRKNVSFAKRRADGTFKEIDAVGRSLSTDRRRAAKTRARRGHGDQGD